MSSSGSYGCEIVHKIIEFKWLSMTSTFTIVVSIPNIL